MMGGVRIVDLLLTLVCAVGITGGQLMFKRAAAHLRPDIWHWGLPSNSWLWTALTVYALSTALWIHVLRTAPLSRVYPLFALAFVMVPVAESLISGQSLRWSALVGGLLIVAGVALSVGRS